MPIDSAASLAEHHKYFDEKQKELSSRNNNKSAWQYTISQQLLILEYTGVFVAI